MGLLRNKKRNASLDVSPAPRCRPSGSRAGRRPGRAARRCAALLCHTRTDAQPALCGRGALTRPSRFSLRRLLRHSERPLCHSERSEAISGLSVRCHRRPGDRHVVYTRFLGVSLLAMTPWRARCTKPAGQGLHRPVNRPPTKTCVVHSVLVGGRLHPQNGCKCRATGLATEPESCDHEHPKGGCKPAK